MDGPSAFLDDVDRVATALQETAHHIRWPDGGRVLEICDELLTVIAEDLCLRLRATALTEASS